MTTISCGSGDCEDTRTDLQKEKDHFAQLKRMYDYSYHQALSKNDMIKADYYKKEAWSAELKLKNLNE